jgi:hypothetical protein
MIEKRKMIPVQSVFKTEEGTFDYIDCFQGEVFSQKNDIDIAEVGRLFLTSGPEWANSLVKVRDKMVGVFGLKTSVEMQQEQNNEEPMKFVPGERLGMFKLGEDDKHLDFRVSLLVIGHASDEKKSLLSMTTAVVYNNWLGRLYFFPVQFFHRLIVRGTMKEMLRKINGDNQNQK